VRVEGSGPMAPMWEAMGRPLLPQLAKAFAAQLRDKIEGASGDALEAPPARTSGFAGVVGWLRSIWNAILGRSESKRA
jgi:hypothetical protein